MTDPVSVMTCSARDVINPHSLLTNNNYFHLKGGVHAIESPHFSFYAVYYLLSMLLFKVRLCSVAVFLAVSSPLSIAAPSTYDEAGMETIDVIGTRMARPVVLTKPGEVTMTLSEIEELQPTNLAELADAIPGVNLDGGARSSGERISIWGFSDPDDINVMVDGAPIGFQQYRYGSFFFDPALISEVYLTKGAHEVRTGNGGFGGTMQLTTKDASDFLRGNDTFGVRLQGGYNTNDELERYSATAYGMLGEDWQFLVNGVFRESSDVTLGNGETLDYSAYEQHNMLAKLSYENLEHRLMLSHSRYKDTGQKPWATRRGGMPEITDRLIEKYGSYDAALYAYTVNNTFTDETTTFNYQYSPISPWVDVELVLAHSKNERHWVRPDIAWDKMYVSVGNYGHESWLSYRRDYASLTNTATLGKHVVESGLQYKSIDRNSHVFNKSAAKNEKKNFGYYTPYFEPSGTQDTYSFYIKDDYHLTDQWLITPSLRYDYIVSEGKENLASDYNDPDAGHDYSKVSHRGWSPRLAVNYQWLPTTAFNFAYAYSLKAPSIDDIYSVQYARASKAISSSRDLELERIHAYKLGVLHQERGFVAAGDHLAAELTLHWNQAENDVAQRRGEKSTEQLQGWRTNLDGYHIYGADFRAFYRLNGWYTDLSASVLRGKHEGPLADSTGTNEYLPGIAPLNVNLGLGYQWYEGLTTGWKVRWYDGQHRTPPADDLFYLSVKSESYTLQELYAEWLPMPSNQDFITRLTVKNLTDRYYEPYLAAGVPGAGRDIRFSVAYKW